jgi:hypothetical protein
MLGGGGGGATVASPCETQVTRLKRALGVVGGSPSLEACWRLPSLLRRKRVRKNG